MRPAIAPPADWPRLSASLYYRDAPFMLDWLCEAFGFTVRIRIDGAEGKIEHSELEYGESLVMVSSEKDGPDMRWGVRMVSPKTAGANTQNLMLFVDDVDSHCEHARSCGATITAEPADYDYGEDYWTDRSYGAVDPEGTLWWFTRRIRDQKR